MIDQLFTSPVCFSLIGQLITSPVCFSLIGHLFTSQVFLFLIGQLFTSHVCFTLIGQLFTSRVCLFLIGQLFTSHVCFSLIGQLFTSHVCFSLIGQLFTSHVCFSKVLSTIAANAKRSCPALCILVGISFWKKSCVPINQKPSCCLWHWNPVNIGSRGNQSIHFNKGKIKVNCSFPLEPFWQDLSGKDSWLLIDGTKSFYQNEMPTTV